MKQIIELSASEVWEQFVGSQSPVEFIEFAGSMSVEKAVAEYATEENFAKMFSDYEGLSDEELEHVRKSMVEYIEQEEASEILAEAGKWRIAQESERIENVQANNKWRPDLHHLDAKLREKVEADLLEDQGIEVLEESGDGTPYWVPIY